MQDIYNLAYAQFDIIFNHFKDEKGDLNLNNLKKAFEDFGQGVLYAFQTFLPSGILFNF